MTAGGAGITRGGAGTTAGEVATMGGVVASTRGRAAIMRGSACHFLAPTAGGASFGRPRRVVPFLGPRGLPEGTIRHLHMYAWDIE